MLVVLVWLDDGLLFVVPGDLDGVLLFVEAMDLDELEREFVMEGDALGLALDDPLVVGALLVGVDTPLDDARPLVVCADLIIVFLATLDLSLELVADLADLMLVTFFSGVFFFSLSFSKASLNGSISDM